LESQTDGQTGGTENGEKRSGLNTDLAEGRDHDEREHQGVDQAGRETDAGGINLTLAEGLAEGAGEDAGDPATDDEDRNSLKVRIQRTVPRGAGGGLQRRC
jgi:hypothetical protein